MAEQRNDNPTRPTAARRRAWLSRSAPGVRGCTKTDTPATLWGKDPETREKLAAQGALVRTQTPEQMAAFIRDETARWAKVVKDAGVKIE